MTIQDSFWSAFLFQKKSQKFNDGFKLFLYQLGTDQLEALFGVIRTQTHASNCSLYELYQRVNMCLQIEQVYAEHPEWRQGNRLCVGTTFDRASANSWIGDLYASDISLPTIWGRGLLKSKKDFISLFLIAIDKIKINDQVKPEISHDLLDNCKIEATLLSLDLCTVDDKVLIWNGQYVKSSKIIVSGRFCSPIKIEYKKYEMNEDGICKEYSAASIPLENLIQIKDYFSQLLGSDLQVDITTTSYCYPPRFIPYLKLEHEKNIAIDDKFTCPHCINPPYRCEKKKLRHHIAKHLLIYKNINPHANLCGFCGFIGCSIGLESTSGKGKNTNFGVDISGCKYGVKFSIGCATSANAPSSNKPIECPHCKLVVWSYNLEYHYRDHHTTAVAPCIDERELARLHNFKK